MTTFLRLLEDKDKSLQLSASCAALRAGDFDLRVFKVDPNTFRSLPKSPFAYWVSDRLRAIFKELPAFASDTRAACVGVQTNDDLRFIRTFWEVVGGRHIPLVKGGSYATFYSDVPMMLRWGEAGSELKASVEILYGTASKHVQNQPYYFRPGITWSQRSQIGLSVRALCGGAIFGVKGPSAFFQNSEDLLPFLSLFNSSAFKTLVSMQMAFGAFDAGVIGRTPVPVLSNSTSQRLKNAAGRIWSLKRSLDTIEETSHAFVLPSALRARLGPYDPSAVEAEMARIQSEIDNLAFDLYGFDEADRAAVHANQRSSNVSDGTSEERAEDDGDDYHSALLTDITAGLLSWAIGVAFSRFDWRLATGERAAPTEPGPFDPLPSKSPGMLQDGAAPFHSHSGILVDDKGHAQDLAGVVEEVLARVEAPVPLDVRRWLQRDFFTFHLQRYSKSRRKAPIYWPLSTTSGSFTLWVYYPSLTNQTLYTAINDFLEPKLKQVGADVTALRNKGSARTRDDEKQFEALQAFELELIELRDGLLKLAPTFKPNHDDGVQITAAPLWPLFLHKPWQKVLKDTWAKLEKGDYDWAHLAMNYWPDRVREKCKTDKSLAIAHGLEHLYVEPEAQPKKSRGRKKAGGDE